MGLHTPLHMNANVGLDLTTHCAALSRALPMHPAHCCPYLLKAWAADLSHITTTAVMAMAMSLAMMQTYSMHCDIVARPMQHMADTELPRVDHIVR